MFIGAGTSAKLQVITSAAADIEISGSKVVVDQSSPPVVDGANTAPFVLASITTATTTDVLAGIASKITRIDELQCYNNSASVTCTVEFLRTDGTNTTSVYSATLLPGESVSYGGGVWAHYDTNGAQYGAIIGQQFPSLLQNPGFSTANLTSTKTITSGSCFAVYVGKATKAVTSAVVRARVTTAAATITWAEVALAKGSINVGGNPSLTVVGFADVSATYNSTGQKSTTINVASGQSINPGDDLWVIIGNAATTAAVVRAASIADDIQVGQQASVASRPSTIVGTPTAFTIEGATTLAAWVGLVV
ncbi:MAG: hypothetical protein AB7U98_13540 [Candidatus Nitrosocosmicus sp.]